MVSNGNTESKTKHTSWKSIENWADNWCQIVCDILFDLIYSTTSSASIGKRDFPFMDTCGEIESGEFDVWDFFKEGISKVSQTPPPASGMGGWNSIFGQTLQNTSFYLVVKKKNGWSALILFPLTWKRKKMRLIIYRSINTIKISSQSQPKFLKSTSFAIKICHLSNS